MSTTTSTTAKTPRPGLFSTLHDDLAAAAFEFISTGYAASSISFAFYVSACMGLSLLAAAWLFYRVTGGLFNPNISLALLMVGAIGPVRFVLYCVAQLFGTLLSPGTSRTRGVFIEMFITAALVLSVLMLAAEKHATTPFAPRWSGITLFACHLFAVHTLVASMNAARSFGPAVVNGFSSDYHKHHWVYWIGPLLGSLLAVSLYGILKHYRYWKLTPHQAARDHTKSPPGPMEGMKGIISGNNPDEIDETPAVRNSFGRGRKARAASTSFERSSRWLFRVFRLVQPSLDPPLSPVGLYCFPRLRNFMILLRQLVFLHSSTHLIVHSYHFSHRFAGLFTSQLVLFIPYNSIPRIRPVDLGAFTH
ncbi:aquaporin-like protein, partial [Coprinopsis sp. MPI-PUGE-AT-0042]